MLYLEDILELCAEAEVHENSSRSVELFEQLRQEKGEDLSIFDCFTVIERLAKEIPKTEPLSKLSVDVEKLVAKIEECYHIAVNANMSPLQIWENNR